MENKMDDDDFLSPPPRRKKAPKQKQDNSTPHYEAPILYPSISTGIDFVDQFIIPQDNGDKNYNCMSSDQQEEERHRMILEISRIAGNMTHMSGNLQLDRLYSINLYNLESIMFQYQYHERIKNNTVMLKAMKPIIFSLFEMFISVFIGIDVPFAQNEINNPIYDILIEKMASQYTTLHTRSDIAKAEDPLMMFCRIMVINMIISILAKKIGTNPDDIKKVANNATNMLGGSGNLFSMMGRFLGNGDDS